MSLRPCLPRSGRALRCRCFDATCAGRAVLRLCTGAQLHRSPRLRASDNATPLLGPNAHQPQRGVYGAVAEADSVAAPRDPPAACSAPGRGTFSDAVWWALWPIRAAFVLGFIALQLFIEFALAPLEAWERLASRARFVDDDADSDAESETESTERSQSGSAAPRHCARSCMHFVACCGFPIRPRRWCRWRCGSDFHLRGFDMPPVESQRAEKYKIRHWRAVAGLIEAPPAEDARRCALPAPGFDPLDILLEILNDAGDGRVLDFARLRLLRHVYDGETAVITYGLLHRRLRGRALAVPLLAKVPPPIPVAVKVALCDFDDAFSTDDALRGAFPLRAPASLRCPYPMPRVLAALQREGRINALIGTHPCIARYFGVCACPPDVALVFQWYGRGTLRAALAVAVSETQRARLGVSGGASTPALVAQGQLPSEGQHYMSVRYVSRAQQQQPQSQQSPGGNAAASDDDSDSEVASLRELERWEVSGLADALPPAACALVSLPSALHAWVARFDAWLLSHAASAASPEQGGSGGGAGYSISNRRGGALDALWSDVTARLGCAAALPLRRPGGGWGGSEAAHVRDRVMSLGPAPSEQHEEWGEDGGADEYDSSLAQPIDLPLSSSSGRTNAPAAPVDSLFRHRLTAADVVLHLQVT